MLESHEKHYFYFINICLKFDSLQFIHIKSLTNTHPSHIYQQHAFSRFKILYIYHFIPYFINTQILVNTTYSKIYAFILIGFTIYKLYLHCCTYVVLHKIIS